MPSLRDILGDLPGLAVRPPDNAPALPVAPIVREPDITDVRGDAAEHMVSALVSPEAAAQLRMLINGEIARRSLFEFVKQAWHVLRSGEVEDAAHVRAICEHVQGVFEGWLVAHDMADPETLARVDSHWLRWGLTRVQGELLAQNSTINAAPGTLKSMIVMVFAPAWYWLRAPRFKVACASANDGNVRRDSGEHRDLVESTWYRETFGITWSIRPDKDAVGDWQTTAGGGRISRTLLAGFTGLHADGILIDDPDDARRVWNEPARREVQGQFSRAVENRVEEETRSFRIIVQQRVHVDDLTAHCLQTMRWSPHQRAGWAQLCIPMEAGMQPSDTPKVSVFGWRDTRAPSELLQPGRFPQRVLDDKRIKMGSHSYESQYNQNPTPMDGGMIKREWLRFFRIEGSSADPRRRPDGCTDEPAYVLGRKSNGALDLDWLTITVDCSNGGEGSSASAVGLLVVGGKGERRFVFDDRTAVMGILAMYAAIKSAICAHAGVGRVLVELKAAGASVIAELKRALTDGDVGPDGVRVRLCGPDGRPVNVAVEAITDVRDGKESRAYAMLAAYQNGMVYLLDGAHWSDEHCAEICVFPHAKRDDRVDAMSQLMTYYRTNGEASRRAMQLNVL